MILFKRFSLGSVVSASLLTQQFLARYLRMNLQLSVLTQTIVELKVP